MDTNIWLTEGQPDTMSDMDKDEYQARICGMAVARTVDRGVRAEERNSVQSRTAERPSDPYHLGAICNREMG